MQIVFENKEDKLQRAREQAYAMPLKDFHPGVPQLFASDTMWRHFERLRKEEPVPYSANGPIEPYWSVTKYGDTNLPFCSLPRLDYAAAVLNGGKQQSEAGQAAFAPVGVMLFSKSSKQAL